MNKQKENYTVIGEHMNWKAFLKERIQEKVIAYREEQV